MGNCCSCFNDSLASKTFKPSEYNAGTNSNSQNSTKQTLVNSTASSKQPHFLSSIEYEDSSSHYSSEINKQDFKILKVIGRGSFGKVYLVQKKDNEKLYAMKTLKKDLTIQQQTYQSTKGKCFILSLTNNNCDVLAEREILEKIDHPFIVKLHFAFQTPSKLYFVMDFLNGGELFYHLKKEGRFSENRTVFYAAEILLALECLHKNGIIYRDLKPENVLLDSDGHIKLTDFGLSKQGVVGNRNTYTFCGTPEYLAPEIVKGKGHSKAVDWWSLVSFYGESVLN